MNPNDTLHNVINFLLGGLIGLAAVIALFLVMAPDWADRLTSDVMSRMDRRSGETITLATGGRSGGYYAKGKALAEALERRNSYTLEVLETHGSVDNLERLRKGDADFALIQGGLPETGSGLVGVAALDMQYAHIIVPRDTDMTAFRDLSGKRVGVGPEDGGSAVLARQLFSFFKFGDPPIPIYDHNVDLEQAFLDGEIDAAFMVYSLFSPAVERLLDTGWYKLLPLREADAVSGYLYGVSPVMLPHSLYGPDRMIPPALGGDVQTVGVKSLLVTRPETPPRVVRALLAGLYTVDFRRTAHLPDLTETWGQDLNEFPMHAAAEAYYTRNEPVSADRFEIASFFLAGLVGVVSAISYLSHRRQRVVVGRRRHAIIPYFEKMLELRQEGEAVEHPEKLMEIAHEMMATQRKAERAWLRGKLDTEHMENLYSVYNFGSRNIFSKISNLHLSALRGEAPVSDVLPPVNEVIPVDDVPAPEPAPPSWDTPEEDESVDIWPAQAEVDDGGETRDAWPVESGDSEASEEEDDAWVREAWSKHQEISTAADEYAEEAPAETVEQDDFTPEPEAPPADPRERSWAAVQRGERPAPRLHRDGPEPAGGEEEDEEEDRAGQMELF